MNGIHHFMSISPVWLSFALLYLVTIDVIHFGREKFEGLAYNVAWSSQYGDLALIMSICVATTILKSKQGIDEAWLQGSLYQFICLAISIVIGLGTRFILPAKEFMDRYHNLVVVPLFIFLLSTMLPVTFFYGSTVEKYVTLCLLVFWLALVVADNITGRINQKQWLTKRGFF